MGDRSMMMDGVPGVLSLLLLLYIYLIYEVSIGLGKVEAAKPIHVHPAGWSAQIIVKNIIIIISTLLLLDYMVSSNRLYTDHLLIN